MGTLQTQIANLERTIKGLRTAQTEIVAAMAEMPYQSRLKYADDDVTSVIANLQSRLSALERQQREENAKAEKHGRDELYPRSW